MRRQRESRELLMALFYLYSECTKFQQEGSKKENEYLISIFISKILFYREFLEYILNEFKLGYYSYYELDYILFLLVTIIDSLVSSIKELSKLIKIKSKNLTDEQIELIEYECIMCENLNLNYTYILFMIRHFKEEDNFKFKDSRKKEKIRINNRFKNLEFLKYIIRDEEFEFFIKNISKSMQNKKDFKYINSSEIELKKSEDFIKTYKETYPKEVEYTLKTIISNKLFLNKIKKLTSSDKVTITYDFKFMKGKHPIPVLNMIQSSKKN